MKNPYAKINQRHLCLGDLVAIVSSCARNERETTVALRDWFASGRVKIKPRGHPNACDFPSDGPDAWLDTRVVAA